MKHIVLTILFSSFLFSSVLEDRVTSKAQTACYLKNSGNGFQASDYTPSITGQSFIQDLTRNSDSCQSWVDNPYVTVDTETYNVIANMSCDVVSTTNNGVTTNTRTIKQYSLTIECNAQCQIPRDTNGNLYEYTPYIYEADCNIVNLQQLLLNEDPNSNYIIDDAQYLTCTSNTSLTACYFKRHVNFGDNTDNNSTDNNSSNNNNNTSTTIDLTGTNSRLDRLNDSVNNLGSKIRENGLKLSEIGTKLDVNGLKIDNLGRNLGIKIDEMGNVIVSELQNQGDRLHADLQALQNNPNASSDFDDSGIINAIHQNTEAIKEIKDLNKGEVDGDTGFFDSYQGYYNDMMQSVGDVENNVNDLMATIQGNYTPQFQTHNTCIIYFPTFKESTPVNMCKYSPILRPYFTFIFTIVMLVLLIRLHFYLFPKVFKSD